MRARGISTGKISLSSTFNEDDCVERLRLSFSFIRGSLRVCLLKRYSYSSAVMRVALVQSYLTKMSYSL